MYDLILNKLLIPLIHFIMQDKQVLGVANHGQ